MVLLQNRKSSKKRHCRRPFWHWQRRFFLCIGQKTHHTPNIRIDANCPLFYFLRAGRLPLVDTDINCLRIFDGHLPEGILDNDRRVEADAQLQKNELLPLSGAEKLAVPPGGDMPPLVLGEGIAAAKVHRHGLAAAGAARHKLRGNRRLKRHAIRDGQSVVRTNHIALRLQHLPDRRFGELKKSIGSVSQKVLTAQLRQMEGSGLLTRTVYPEVPPRVEYTLTELGYSLKPILDAMWTWGEAYKQNQA